MENEFNKLVSFFFVTSFIYGRDETKNNRTKWNNPNQLNAESDCIFIFTAGEKTSHTATMTGSAIGKHFTKPSILQPLITIIIIITIPTTILIHIASVWHNVPYILEYMCKCLFEYSTHYWYTTIVHYSYNEK